MSDGGTVNPAQRKDAKPKKKAWYTTKFEEKDAQIAELQRKLDAMNAGAPLEALSDNPYADAPAPVFDPLAWITEKDDGVAMVSSTAIINLNPEDPGASPPVRSLKLEARGVSEWAACPFEIGDRNDHIRDMNLKIFKAEWWHLVVTKRVAELYYRNCPWKKARESGVAVVTPDSFTGWDAHTQEPMGVLERIDEFVPLRELVRELLQRVGEIYLDHGARRPGQEWDLRFPNPYNNRITDVPTEFQKMPVPPEVAQARETMVIRPGELSGGSVS